MQATSQQKKSSLLSSRKEKTSAFIRVEHLIKMMYFYISAEKRV